MKWDVKVYAAGSLRKVLPAMFEKTGLVAEIEFGPSGVLKDRIINGEKVDLFVSANMKHAYSLAGSGLSNDPLAFTQNELCLFGRKQVLKSGDALSLMLDSRYKLGTSTPIDDPGGDYAFAVFDKADAVARGASDKLRKKALTLVGGKSSNIKCGSHSPVYVLFKENLVDMFLGYRTTAKDLMSRIDGLVIVELPESLKVRAEYGAVVVNSSVKGEQALNLLMTPKIREILVEYGFSN